MDRSDIGKLHRRMCECRNRIEQIREGLGSAHVDLRRTRVHGSPNPDRMLDGVARIIELEQEIDGLETEIAGIISQALDGGCRKILTDVFLHDRSVKDVAEESGMSARQVYRIIRSAWGEG